MPSSGPSPLRPRSPRRRRSLVPAHSTRRAIMVPPFETLTACKDGSRGLVSSLLSSGIPACATCRVTDRPAIPPEIGCLLNSAASGQNPILKRGGGATPPQQRSFASLAQQAQSGECGRLLIRIMTSSSTWRWPWWDPVPWDTPSGS